MDSSSIRNEAFVDFEALPLLCCPKKKAALADCENLCACKVKTVQTSLNSREGSCHDSRWKQSYLTCYLEENVF